MPMLIRVMRKFRGDIKIDLRIVGFVLSLCWAQIWADSLKNEATKVSNTH